MKILTVLVFLVLAFSTKKCDPKPQPHPVNSDKELLIVHPDVLNSPEATRPDGAFSIKTLLTNMAPQANAKELLLSLLTKWEDPNARVNSFPIPPRDHVRREIIEPWKAKDGQPGVSDANWIVNFANSPFRLRAIVNRFDLKRTGPNKKPLDAGEGRFVFGVEDAAGTMMSFSLILEYEQQAKTDKEVKQWASAWHHLGSFPDFGPGYIAALKQVTDGFAGRNVMPNKPSGSALNQLRTNALFGDWELREFHLRPADGLFEQAMNAQTPDDTFNSTQRLTDYINRDEQDLINKRHRVPDKFPGQDPFRGGHAKVGISAWTASGRVDPEARFRFSFNTCSGCHNGETGASFFHIDPRQAVGSLNAMSRFMRESFDINDPVTGGKVNRMKEMEERVQILSEAVGLVGFKAAAAKAIDDRRSRVH